MPIEAAQQNGRPGYRWGHAGTIYCYAPGDEAQRQRARHAAEQQGRAVLAARAARGDAAPITTARVLFPHRLEEQYRRRLNRRVHAAHSLLLERMAGVLASVGPDLDARARRDSEADDLARMIRVIEEVRLIYGQTFNPTPASLVGIGQQVGLFAIDQQERSMPTVAAIDVMPTRGLQDLYSGWARKNADLIKTIDARFFDDIAASVRESVQTGRSTRDLLGEIRDRYAVSRSRAALIARDQIASLNGQITEKRQTDLGVKRYKWLTLHDERVRGNPGGLYPDARPSHWDRHGQIFDWSDPPEGGHPGAAINCRCGAVAVLDDP